MSLGWRAEGEGLLEGLKNQSRVVGYMYCILIARNPQEQNWQLTRLFLSSLSLSIHICIYRHIDRQIGRQIDR